jgi:hypothetical protein
VSLIVENPHANANARQRASMSAPPGERRGKSLPKGKTALAMKLSDAQLSWLAEYASDQWTTLHGSLSTWRTKLAKYERQAESNRQDRKGSPNPDASDAPKTIFDHSNRSLGLVSGFADFAFAQARDDMFGTSPWFAAQPQGTADEKLSTAITRHAHWKFAPTNLKEGFIDAIRYATDLGTGFPKVVWRRELETFETIKQVAHDAAGNPLLKMDGTFATEPDDLEDPTLIASYKEMVVEDQTTVYDNVEARCIDYNDIAFDNTAPELSLLYTDVFHRFQIGLLDAKSVYNLTDEQYAAALDLMTSERSGAQTPRDHRGESSAASGLRDSEPDANPPIVLVEGYLRCNPFGTGGTPTRIYCVFSPALRTVFSVDYLANQTPDGILPIFPVRWFKVPNRIIGKGYFERCEDVEEFIDSEFNATIYRDSMAANPPGGIDMDVLDEDMEEGAPVTMAPGKLWKVKPGQSIDKAFSFISIPDANSRTIDLLNMMTQMAQMRFGISSASQGELKGLPESNTATGVNQIISRGAVLLKWPIDEVKGDLTRPLECAITLLYANQDADETFVWSEGKEPELMEIKRSDVRNLKLNVAITMTQSQNQTKLANGMAGIDAHSKYILIPEPEKGAARPLFLQAIQALGFNAADQIIREPVTDAAGIAAMLPPELQPAFLTFAQQNGLVAAPAPGTGPQAPVAAGPPLPEEIPPAASIPPAPSEPTPEPP